MEANKEELINDLNLVKNLTTSVLRAHSGLNAESAGMATSHIFAKIEVIKAALSGHSFDTKTGSLFDD